ncbi:hypothetical protein Tco_1432179, partial [Tanacetum coccineum]
VAGQAEKKTEPEQEYILIPFFTTDPLISQGEEDEQDTRSEFERLLQQEKQTNSTNSFNIVGTPVSAAGPSFTNVDPSSPVNVAEASNVFEDHLIERFSPFKNAFALPHVPNVSPIDDNTGIFASAYDDEDVGGQADLNNLETTMNVSSIPTTRINKDHIIELIIGDLHSALLTRRMSQQNLEEHCLVSYINKQRRTNHKDYQNCLFACFLSQKEPKKVIQALKDPSWIEAIQEELLQFELQKVWTLVDLPNGKRPLEQNGLEAIRLFFAYALFMGFIVYQMDAKSAFLYGTIKEEIASTPMEPNKALIKDEEANSVDVHLYRSMNGSLMYLTASRPYIMFAIYACARDSPFDLEAFSDSDYAGASLDRKSTTRGCQFLGKRLISWQCNKQTIVANSTTEAEYVDASN